MVPSARRRAWPAFSDRGVRTQKKSPLERFLGDPVGAMTSRGSQHRAWDDDRVARELEAWFAKRAFERWPTYRTFVRDGHKVLYGAVIDSGGPERWAFELGVPYIPHRSGGGLTHHDTHAVLRQLLREHHPGRFPTLAWLKRHGPPGLAAAVTRTGGAAHWAAVLHMPPPPHARWTDELIEAELRRICRDATCWPSRADFEAVGATGLLRAVYAGRGSRWWAQRLGLSTDGLRARRRQHLGTPPSP
jgi:hypothetical protein